MVGVCRMLHLQGAGYTCLWAAVQVEHNLGGAVDRLDRQGGMRVAQDHKIGHRVGIQIGAGQLEKIAQHPVAVQSSASPDSESKT
jgi:hypothetical protein